MIDLATSTVRYRHERLANCGALALFDGTIFSDRFIWLQTKKKPLVW